MRFLITGARAPVALDLSRSLTMAGHEVFVADVFVNQMLKSSRSVRGFHTYAAPRARPMAFQADIRELVSSLGIDRIIPLCEEVFYLAQAARAGPLPLFSPDIDTLMRFHSKFEFAALCNELGLFVPETHRLEGRMIDALRPHAKRLVFKPEFSRFGALALVRPKPEALDELNLDPHNPWLYQDYVEGEDLSFYAIALNGQIHAFSAYRSSWRTSGGASFYFDPVSPDQAAPLRLIAQTLAAATRLNGQLACDLRLDAKGTFWLLEANPRATSGLHLLTHEVAGLAKLMSGKAPTRPIPSATRPGYVGPAMWMSGLPLALLRRRLDQWQADMKRGQDVIGSATDGGAIWGAVADSLVYGARAIANRCSLSALLSQDIACNARLE